MRIAAPENHGRTKHAHHSPRSPHGIILVVHPPHILLLGVGERALAQQELRGLEVRGRGCV